MLNALGSVPEPNKQTLLVQHLDAADELPGSDMQNDCDSEVKPDSEVRLKKRRILLIIYSGWV